MITLVTKEGLSYFLSFAQKDVYGLRMAAYAAAYGPTYEFARFWVQEWEGKLTAAVSKIDCDVAVTVTPAADRAELYAFLNAIGFSSLFCEEGFEKGLRVDAAQYGWVMEQVGALPQQRQTTGRLEDSPHLKEVYSVLNGAQSDWVAVKNFEGWYADVSHRIRHKTAQACLLRAEDGAPAAVVMLLSVTEHAVIMGGVATLPQYRRRGYGSILIRHFAERLKAEKKQIFLLREDGKNEEFYHALGFTERTRWCVAERKDKHEGTVFI